ncbi:MAG TPA: glycoside hydrolase family 30 beta sandwich domain-containing protein [Terriglobales bacterium]|nr:glycoside hydrolase family 30 beta sandwich domain-containing protein [Terriglobales bacterium]
MIATQSSPMQRLSLGRLSTILAAVLTGVLVGCGGGGGTPSSGFNPTGPTAQVIMTTGDQSKLLASQAAVEFGTGGTENSDVITLNEATRYQPIDGFGASLTDSAAWVIWNDLSPSQQSSLMQQLFSPTAGIGLSFLRQPMGASDFAVNGNYSYDDVPAGQTDPQLVHFSVAHDDAYIIPLLQQAIALNPQTKIVALPWSPPAWMKTSSTMNGGDMDTTYFSSLAQYFVLFLQAYQNAGIPVYAISVQNEPLNSTGSYPSESLSASDESDFIANDLAPALATAGLSNIKILGYEHNWDNTSYPESVLASSAGASVAGTSFHCYAGDVGAQSAVEAAYPGKDIWFTECSGTVGSSFAGDLVWNSQNLLIGATRNWARSISLWNLALDQNSGPQNGGCTNCRGVVTVDSSASPATITFNVEYYVLGHLSKFVVPGAYRVDSSTGSGGIEDVAFQNPDGTIVLFVLNSATTSQDFAVSWKGTYFNYSLPAQSVATFTWKQN